MTVQELLQTMTEEQLKAFIAQLAEKYLRLRRHRGTATVLLADDNAALVDAVEAALTAGAKYIEVVRYDAVEDAQTMHETLYSLLTEDNAAFMELMDDVLSREEYGTPDHGTVTVPLAYAVLNLGLDGEVTEIAVGDVLLTPGVGENFPVNETDAVHFSSGTGYTFARTAVTGAGGTWSADYIHVPSALFTGTAPAEGDTVYVSSGGQNSATVDVIENPVIETADLDGEGDLTLAGIGLTGTLVVLRATGGLGSGGTIASANFASHTVNEITVDSLQLVGYDATTVWSLRVTEDAVNYDSNPLSWTEPEAGAVITDGFAYIDDVTPADSSTWVQTLQVEGTGFGTDDASILTIGVTPYTRAAVVAAGGAWTDTQINVPATIAGPAKLGVWSAGAILTVTPAGGSASAPFLAGVQPFVVHGMVHQDPANPGDVLLIGLQLVTSTTDIAFKVGPSGLLTTYSNAQVMANPPVSADLTLYGPGPQAGYLSDANGVAYDVMIASATTIPGASEALVCGYSHTCLNAKTYHAGGLATVEFPLYATPYIESAVLAAGAITVTGHGFATTGMGLDTIAVLFTMGGAPQEILDSAAILGAGGSISDTEIVIPAALNTGDPWSTDYDILVAAETLSSRAINYDREDLTTP